MWRSFFMAVGVTFCILGVECLLIDKAVIIQRSSEPGIAPSLRDFHPPEWAPWSLLAAGAVVIIYTFTLPKKWKE